VDLPDVFVSSVLASLVLSVIGMMVSLHVHRRLSGIVLGGAVGACLGIVAGPLCLVPRGSFSHLLVVGLAGAAALLGIAAASRLTARGSRVGATPVDDPDR
jgi:hypothetical protein